MVRRLAVSPRATPSVAVRVGTPLVSLLAAAIAGGFVVIVAGNNPLEAYRAMFDASFNGWRSFTRTLTLATPLTLTGLAAAVSFRMKIWNIGAEGQLYMGAIASSGLALALPENTPKFVMLSVILVGGALAGALWAGLAAIPKAMFNTDEVITTLMLTFIALSFMNYLIFGSGSFWRDPDASFPVGKIIPESAELPIVSHRLHFGFVIALGAAILLWWVLRRTTWGFELRTIGDSPAASRYAGMHVRTKVVSVLALSGALAGLAGAIEVSGVHNTLDPRAIAIELGFTGIVVAAVARFNPLGVVPVATLLAAVVTSGSALQRIGIDSEIVFLLQGLIFLFVAAGEFFITNEVSFSGQSSAEDGTTSITGGVTS
jgi:ABC-type uncharacterized transport system permease subunit